MLQAIRREAIVGPGGSIELRAPEMPEGAHADVIVLLRDEPKPELAPLAAFVGAARGVYGSVEEIDEYIRQHRDEWD